MKATVVGVAGTLLTTNETIVVTAPFEVDVPLTNSELKVKGTTTVVAELVSATGIDDV